MRRTAGRLAPAGRRVSRPERGAVQVSTLSPSAGSGQALRGGSAGPTQR